ncbi:MAG: MFS transporter, partial [Solirubrobacteraceae bacterium]
MPEDRRWWALAALVPGVLTIGFDLTILNVALPTIARELSVGTDALQWIVNSYVLVFAGLLLPAGVLGDRYGRKRLLLIALGLFGAVSVIAAVADSSGLVIAARAVMGLGAAAILPITLAVLTVLFPEKRERGKAIAVIVTAVGVGFPLGPIIGGYLLEHFWWGSIFLINVPMAALAMIAIAVLLPASRDPAPPRLDVPGGVLSTAGLVIFVYAVIDAPERGWEAPLVLGGLAAGMALLAAFVSWELRARQPLIDLRLFGRPSFLWGTVATAVAGFAIFGLFFTLPQYLQFVAGHEALATGLRLLPMIGGLVVGAGLGERLAARVGHRAPVALGLLLIAAGLAAGATTQVTSGYGFVAAWLALAGVGLGASLAVATDAVLGALPPERSGGGIALTCALRQA